MANFEKFGDLIYKNSNEREVEKFIEKFVTVDLSKITAIEDASNICEFINNCEDLRVQKHLQTYIYKNYQSSVKEGDQMAMAVYSLLGSNIGHRASIHKDWYQKWKKSCLNIL